MIVVDLRVLQLAPDGASGWYERLLGAVESAGSRVIDRYVWDDHLARSSAFDRFVDRPGIVDRLRSYTDVAGSTCVVLVRHAAEPGETGTVRHRAVPWSPPVRARRTVTVVSSPPAATTPIEVARLAGLAASDRVVVPTGTVAGEVIAAAGVARSRVEVVGLGPLPLAVPADAARRDVIVGVLSSCDDVARDATAVVDAAARLGRGATGPTVLLVSPADIALVQGVLGEGVAELVVDTDEARAEHLSGAAVVVVPSSRTGTTVADAIGTGVPVVVGNAGVHLELVPDAYRRFPTGSIDDLADALDRVLADRAAAARSDRPRPDLSWARAASRFRRLVTGERDRTGPVPRSDRTRLALVGSVPPTMGGVASHTAALAAAFGRCDDVDLELFTASAPAVIDIDVPVRPVAELPLRWRRGEFDHVLYCLGNDPNHRPIADMARQVPGGVLAHDVRLVGLFGPAGPSGDPGDPEWMTLPIASIAAPLLVMSQHAADLVHEVTGRRAVHVGPLPSWTVGAGDAVRDHPVPVVASMGIAHEIKRTDVFVAAAELVAQERDVEAVIVGPGGDRFVGPDSSVRTAGLVTDAEFDRWLSSADLLVQLRRDSNGESSGVAVQAAARGTPLIVSDVGAMSELPDSFARKVPVDIGAHDLASVIAEVLDDDGWLAAARVAGLEYAATETVDRQARRIIDTVWGATATTPEDA